jgi:AraC family transcriptional regulator, regulatory protein of adaptative response / DNA-3-methyladenine glycosylase II
VALAAGFGSVRRFNEVFTQLYWRSPGALRGRSGSAVPAASSNDLVIRLPRRSPYDWPAIVAFLQARAIPGVEYVSTSQYIRTIEINRVHGVIAVQPKDAHLQATIRFSRLASLPVIIERVRRIFDLGADPDGIDAHLAEDPALAPLVAARPGLRVPGAWDGFELAVRAVLGQQITVSAAVGLAGQLVQRHGEPLAESLRVGTQLTHVFPLPERIATRTSPPLVFRGRGRERCPHSLPLSPRILTCSAGAGAFMSAWNGWRVCRALGNGRRSTSPCASCANRTPFRSVTSV